MDPNTSLAAVSLTRPRLAIQVVTGLAAAFILYQAWQQRETPISPCHSARASTSLDSNGLHRSNAVRRPERSARLQIEGALDDMENEYGYTPEQRQQLESILERHFGRRDGPHPVTSTSNPEITHPDPNLLHSNENVGTQGPLQHALAGTIDGEGETVAGEEPLGQSEWDGDSWLMPPPRSGHNIVGLLFRVSEDNARRNAYVHRGCMCNACGLLPIRGIRYRCANCADFDLCETCESQGLHIKTHVFYKVRVPAPPFGPKSMQPVWYPGDPDNALRNLPSSLIKHLARETGFERPELEALWEQWTFIANTEWRDDPDELYLAADRWTFERYLIRSCGSKRTAPNLIHDRMFAFYDTNGDDLISFPEFLKGLSYKKGKERLERIFKGYDIDGDGYVSRRDCLRIFRTYYVLYKHMHGDVIEGLDQQALHNTDTHQLITGRQPLSSHFGREGRVPEADHGRVMEGKVFHGNGDVYVTDKKNGVVNENKPDTGDREEILSSLFSHPGDSEIPSTRWGHTSEHVTSPPGDELSRIHHEAILNPLARVEEFVSLLMGESRNNQPSDENPENHEEQQNTHDNECNDEDTFIEEDDTEVLWPVQNNETASRDTNPTMGYTVTTHGARPTETTTSPAVAVPRDAGDERWTTRAPTDSQLRAHILLLEAHRKRVTDRNLRDAVRRKLFDRWKKRNFYLVNEEGTNPPRGFDQEDDVLAVDANVVALDSTDRQHPLSARSRSSSKVRFAEDTDDYETRSNPSTSSRTVPERWGGMDIPDAEKDMGKEILYVVTQQAFNELLDVLFKEKEDLALQAAESRGWRNAYRDILDSFDSDQPASGTQPRQHSEHENGVAVVTEVDENKPIQSRNLSELLATSDYVVSEILASNASQAQDRRGDELNNQYDDDQNSSYTSVEEEPELDETPLCDPTMPQFRPHSVADLAESNASRIMPRLKSSKKGLEGDELKGETQQPKQGRPLTQPTQARLTEWKKHDAAEKDAHERGGWGRLTLDEFKHIWHREEKGLRRLDYLGTWIDFCVP